GDRITEVAALRIDDGRVVERFVSLVNCGVRIPPFIVDYTGITQAMVDNAPPVDEVVPQLIDFIGADTLAAHNASFDDKFLTAELLLHIGRHLGRQYGLERLDPSLLESINRLAAAKVARYLGDYAAERRARA